MTRKRTVPCSVASGLDSLSRRRFLQTCLGLSSGLAGALTLPSWARGWTLAQSLAPETLVLFARVVTCADASSPVAPVYEKGAVLVHRGRIQAVGPRGSVPVDDAAMQLDLPDATLVPGIIDCHVHDVAADAVRRRLLLDGVTTVGDVGSPLTDLAEFARPHPPDGLPLASVFGTGPVLGPEGGYPGRVWSPQYGLAVETPRQAARAAHRVLDHGASMIKIAFEPGPDGRWPLLGLKQAQAIVAAGHERGVPVRCHVQDVAGLSFAVQAGVDAVEHTPLRSVVDASLGPVFTGERGRLVPGPGHALGLRRLADAGIMLVPTLLMGVQSDWDGSGTLAAVRHFHDSGGVMALGSDAPMRGVAHGMPAGEMTQLAACGLSGEAVLLAATRHAARAIGQEQQLGSIEPGKRADMITLAGDPCDSAAWLHEAGVIIKDGVILPESFASA